MSSEINGFKYIYTDNKSDRTLMLLHGTGGDEHDLIPFANEVAPLFNLLSPRGRILEHGMPRFFKRFSEGVLDIENLTQESKELFRFILETSKKHNFKLENLILMGFSNGANMALHLLTSRKELVSGILIRSMPEAISDELDNLDGKSFLINSGKFDPLMDPTTGPELQRLLLDRGASVELNVLPAGHGLQMEDIELIRAWLISD